jgi:hypothetical protein
MGTTEALIIPLLLLIVAVMCGEVAIWRARGSKAVREERAAQFRALRRELRRGERHQRRQPAR